jgi:hypothetical protein
MRSARVFLVLAAGATWVAACGTTIVDQTTSTSGAGGGGAQVASSVAASSGGTPSGTVSAVTATSGAGGDDPGPVAVSTGEGAGDPAGSGGFGAGGSSGGSGAGDPGTGGGSASACLEVDYCSCVANAACRVVAEDCFCPCGEEPCEPDCECDCGGGDYLGCAPTSVSNPGVMEVGVWLIGWSGGANHFSWIRFEDGGALTMLDGADMPSNLPYWECNGPGDWILGAAQETVIVTMPGDCAFSPLRFEAWMGDPTYPEGALQAATVFDGPDSDFPLTAYRFPDAQCAPDLSSCTDPFGF